jgi:hypothetical protein
MGAVRFCETSADLYNNRKTGEKINSERNNICTEEA